MFEVRQTEDYRKWERSLKDIRARVQIARRLDRAAQGNLGDVKFFDGIGEMRIDVGPGYRIYFVQRGKTLVILICGGTKKSQNKDIRRARDLAQEIE
jgi:putative addiction module killer protein